MRGKEAGCFWLGSRSDETANAVAAIVVPRQQNHRGQYHVAADAMIQVANVARSHGWKNLAQVHSHPGAHVRHSDYDDEMANSRRALSLVYPHYGAARGLWRFRGWLFSCLRASFPIDIGVHAFTGNQWRFLSPADIARCITITIGPPPLLLDLRR